MLTRISNITSFEHVQASPRFRTEPGTNIVHHWHDDYYASRVRGHLTAMQVEEYEEAFLERRHRRHA